MFRPYCLPLVRSYTVRQEDLLGRFCIFVFAVVTGHFHAHEPSGTRQFTASSGVYVPPVVRPRVWCHPRLLKSILEMSLGILGEVGEEVIARKHCFLLQLHFTPRRSGFLDRRSDRRSDSLDPRVTVVPVVTPM